MADGLRGCTWPYSAAAQQGGGPRPAPLMQSRQSRGRPSNTKCLINLLICLRPQGMKSLLPRHLRPRAASAMLLTRTRTDTHAQPCYPLSGLLTCRGGNKESPLITSIKAPPGDKHLTGCSLGRATAKVK